MRVRLIVIGLVALTMTSTALALSCAFPVETATLEFDAATFDDEATGDDLGIAEITAYGEDFVELRLTDPDGLLVSVGLERVGGAP